MEEDDFTGGLVIPQKQRSKEDATSARGSLLGLDRLAALKRQEKANVLQHDHDQEENGDGNGNGNGNGDGEEGQPEGKPARETPRERTGGRGERKYRRATTGMMTTTDEVDTAVRGGTKRMAGAGGAGGVVTGNGNARTTGAGTTGASIAEMSSTGAMIAGTTAGGSIEMTAGEAVKTTAIETTAGEAIETTVGEAIKTTAIEAIETTAIETTATIRINPRRRAIRRSIQSTTKSWHGSRSRWTGNGTGKRRRVPWTRATTHSWGTRSTTSR